MKLNSKKIAGALLAFCLAVAGETPVYGQNPISRGGKSKTTTTKKTTTSKTTTGSRGKKPTGTTGAKQPSQPTKVTNGPLTKTVLYSLGKNETVANGEYTSNMKSQGHNFSLMTRDNDTKIWSLIVNGKKIASGKYLHVPLLDYNNPSKNIIAYSQNENNDYYVKINNVAEGPYEDISFPNYAPNTYLFKRMGRFYRRDADGTIYAMDGTQFWNAHEPDAVYSSPSGRRKIKFSDNYQFVTVDGNKYRIPVPDNAQNVRIFESYISDSGNVYIRMNYQVDGNDKYPAFELSKGYYSMLDYDKYYENLQRDYEKDGYIWMGEFGKGVSNMYDKESWNNGGYDINFRDPSGRHLFSSAWNYDYVMIDSNTVKCNPPFFAYYDPSITSFVWISEENNKVMQYSYKL